MINISFDNPYLLLLAIPLALLVIIPFCIAIRRENSSKETTIALIAHLLIVAMSVLAVAGMKNTTIMTKTEVYVVADVSDSTSAKADTIDAYINELKAELPKNSEMGVVTFAKEPVLNTPMGGEFITVKNSGLDASATDILSALKYTDTLFEENTLKRVVLYTDGFSTDTDTTGELIRTLENMNMKGIYIDVVYIDSNITGDTKEFQVSDVEFNASTYLGHKNSANILVESTVESGVIVRLSKNGEAFLEKTANVTPGYNIVSFDLYTEEEGEYDYEVSIYNPEDTSSFNNTYAFTQSVNSTVSVMLVTDNAEDVALVEAIYDGGADVTAFVKPKQPKPTYTNPNPKPVPFDIPFTVEDLCQYDQFVISNVNLEEVNNADSFIKSLDICVSQFGKSLITAGDNGVQNSEATAVQSLANMLPVKFGNGDANLYVIVIDSSRSMEFKNFDFFRMAKNAAKYLLDLLDENDYFTIINFSGEVYVPMLPLPATDEYVAEAKTIIENLKVTQGTMIGAALDEVYASAKVYSELCSDIQVMLISDGMSFEGGETLQDDPIKSAGVLKSNNIIVSTLNAGNTEEAGVETMKMIAAAGGGKYYFSKSSNDLEKVMFDEIADDVTETFVEKTTEVIVNRPNDDVLDGIGSIPAIEAYVYARSKASAENILFVEYEKTDGTKVKVPLYAYWSYGNGRVATLTTSLGGAWAPNWQEGNGFDFLHNINKTNIPATKVDYPYTVDVSFDGKYTHIEIVPAVLNPDATMTVTVTFPDGTEQTKLLTFDSYRYFYEFETGGIGKYIVSTSYDWVTRQYSSTGVFNISYSPEYDRFNTYSPAGLHTIVRENGTVTENGNAVLVTDPSRLDTYVYRYTVPLLAAAAALYIIDTVIRKLKWADIKSFFKRKKRREANK